MYSCEAAERAGTTASTRTTQTTPEVRGTLHTHDTCTRVTMVGPFCDALEGGVAAVARTIDRGAVDPNVDKHALASAASQLWPWCCWYTARTTSIGTSLTREIPTHLTVVGLATVPEGGPTAVAVPLVVHILKFAKHGLAFAATARAKHLAMYCHCTASVTVTVTPRA